MTRITKSNLELRAELRKEIALMTAIINKPGSNTIVQTIGTDEGDSKVIIRYDYQRTTDALGDYGVYVSNISFDVLTKTETPEYVLMQQVKELIKETHYGLTVEFED